jgi:hypothetical protein
MGTKGKERQTPVGIHLQVGGDVFIREIAAENEHFRNKVSIYTALEHFLQSLHCPLII